MSEKDPNPRPGMTLPRWALPVAGIVVLGLVAAVAVLFIGEAAATRRRPRPRLRRPREGHRPSTSRPSRVRSAGSPTRPR